MVDGADQIFVETAVSPCGFSRIEQVIDVSTPAGGSMITTHVMPQVIHRIEFRRVRWQADAHDIGRADQAL